MFRTMMCAAALFFLTSQSAYPEEPVQLDKNDCQIVNDHEVFETVEHKCTFFNYENKGTQNTFLITYSDSHVLFASFFQGGPGLYFPFSGNAKTDTKKYLREWNYINENWVSISKLKRKNKTAFTANNTKVILYNINLQKERGCIGFAKGAGDNTRIQGGRGSNQIMTGLLCSLTESQDLENLISVFEKTNYKKAR